MFCRVPPGPHTSSITSEGQVVYASIAFRLLSDKVHFDDLNVVKLKEHSQSTPSLKQDSASIPVPFATRIYAEQPKHSDSEM